MLSPQFRATNILPAALVVLIAAAIGYWSAQAGALAAPAKDAKGAKLNSLLQERLTALREAAALTTKAYETGTESFAEVIAANQAVRNAELELCSTDKERMNILEKMAAEAREYERTAVQRAATGLVSPGSGLRAKANRLEIEIALERMKSK
jgi:outer membrane protein TolC